MAENLDDGEFWLPSQFLTDTDDDTSTNGFNSDLGSPVESVTETESDEDEFLSELTRQMARYSLLQDSPATASQKCWIPSGSPQSILSPVGDVRTLGGCEGGSSRGSPTGPLSPTPAPAKVDYFKVSDGATLDLLHVAAGEVTKMTMRTDQPQKGTGYFDSNRGLNCQPRKHTNPNFHGFFPHQSTVPQQQLQAYQFQQLWSQEMMMKQQNQVISNGRSNINNRPLGLSTSAWPPLKHPTNRQMPAVATQNHLPGSGMRAVFLGNPGSKRESTGTGVFLPRRVNPTETRKNTTNPGCSTVLVPEKVVQALNNINVAQSRSQPQPRPDTNGKLRGQANGFHGPRRNTENARSQSGAEIRLPSEWTY
ncbi:hypothetical protein V2J09_009426 [Rumex salicifolius]